MLKKICAFSSALFHFVCIFCIALAALFALLDLCGAPLPWWLAPLHSGYYYYYYYYYDGESA